MHPNYWQITIIYTSHANYVLLTLYYQLHNYIMHASLAASVYRDRGELIAGLICSQIQNKHVHYTTVAHALCMSHVHVHVCKNIVDQILADVFDIHDYTIASCTCMYDHRQALCNTVFFNVIFRMKRCKNNGTRLY